MKQSNRTVTVKMVAGKEYNWTYLAEIIANKIIKGDYNK